ncbi:MAG TPA: toll/interleukin-1 receptor domain-containing protein [Allosphingosinicella sp.]|nr:toll/interleukin-1 receptor domain-containing protein [Allosphingosinicella sp.]
MIRDEACLRPSGDTHCGLLGVPVPRVFFSYCHADEALRDQLEKQLALLKRQGVIDTWHDRRIHAGEEFANAIDMHLEDCEIILLLVSSDFLASDYCYDIEMKRAMERHEAGEAVVIPVILRSCLWSDAPFGKLNATPPDGKPVTQWSDRDQAFTEVAKAIKKAAERFQAAEPNAASTSMRPQPTVPPSFVQPRSSNLRVSKEFSERDKDRFKHETFEFIANFFANSLDELSSRNPGIEGDFRRIDANRFIAVVYRHGKAVARCSVFIGGSFFGNGIAYSANEATESNSCNETLSVEADEQMLYLTSMGMSFGGRGERDPKLSQEGAAELYWSMLVEPLQRGSH